MMLRLPIYLLVVGMGALCTAGGVYAALPSAQEQMNSLLEAASSQVGTIMALDLEDRIIQIDKNKYELADNIVIFSTEYSLVSKISLSVGQKIEYWTSRTSTLQGSNNQLTYPIVSKIRIISGYKNDAIPK